MLASHLSLGGCLLGKAPFVLPSSPCSAHTRKMPASSSAPKCCSSSSQTVLCLRSCNQGGQAPTCSSIALQHSPHPLVGAMSGSGGSGHFAAAGFDPRAPPGGLGMPSQALPSHLQAYPQYAGLPYLSQQQQQQQQHQQQQELYAQQLAQRCVAHVCYPQPHQHASRT